MARKQSAQAEQNADRAASIRRGFLIASSVAALVVVGLAGVYAFSRLESYLIRDRISPSRRRRTTAKRVRTSAFTA